MRGTRWMAGLMVTLTMAGLGGCSESTGPEGPSVAGTWTGAFRGSDVRMVLTQRGSEVSGTLEVGRRSHAVDGSVDAAGTFSFSTDVWESNCSAYSSSGLQLESQAEELNGVARRASSAPPCGSGGRVLVEQGLMELVKAF